MYSNDQKRTHHNDHYIVYFCKSMGFPETPYNFFMGKIFNTWKNSQKNTNERKQKRKETTLNMYNCTKSINYHHTPQIIYKDV